MGFIGVIDSGVGGLTILQQLQQSHPYNYCYIADHAFCPYGNKSNDVIYSRASKLVRHLQGQGAQAVVLACNTMSCFADKLQQEHNLPIYDVITPTCKRLGIAVRAKSPYLLQGLQSQTDTISNCFRNTVFKLLHSTAPPLFRTSSKALQARLLVNVRWTKHCATYLRRKRMR